MRIVFIPKHDSELTIIKNQLKQFCREDIFVCLKKDYIEKEGDVVELGVKPDKESSLLLDYSGNLERFGTVDSIFIRKVAIKQPMTYKGEIIEETRVFTGENTLKFCPKCELALPKQTRNCPECSYIFSLESLATTASNRAAMSTDKEEALVYDVLEATYSRHKKAGKPDSFKITYNVGAFDSIQEFLLFDHGSWGLGKARARWGRQMFETCRVPETTAEALQRADAGELRTVTKIKAIKEKGFIKVIAWKFKDEPMTNGFVQYGTTMSEKEQEIEDLLDGLGF